MYVCIRMYVRACAGIRVCLTQNNTQYHSLKPKIEKKYIYKSIIIFPF